MNSATVSGRSVYFITSYLGMLVETVTEYPAGWKTSAAKKQQELPSVGIITYSAPVFVVSYPRMRLTLLVLGNIIPFLSIPATLLIHVASRISTMSYAA